MTLTPALIEEYRALFRTCRIRPANAEGVDRVARRLVTNQSRYEAVTAVTRVPWFVVAVIHQLESSGSFTTHLHNGDPLTARTVHVPKGRPAAGTPPFAWEVSAADAMRDLSAVQTWTLARTLFELEKFNGFGYRKIATPINSPYLWSTSQHYLAGKFTADGTYSPTAVSKQIGAAVLLLRFTEIGAVAEVLA